MNLIEKLHSRYASKMMNGTALDNSKVETILESIRLAPTSLGLQPFKVLVIKNQDLKQRIFETAAQGQPQITGCSHLLVFAAYRKITNELVASYFDLIRSTRQLPEEKLAGFRAMIDKSVVNGTADQNFKWATNQAYIALGFALVSAAVHDVDSVPIEGFNPNALNEILNLDAQNLGSVCMMAIGNRDAEKDYNALLPKVRKSNEDLFLMLD